VSKDNIIKLIQPGNVEDQLTEILRNGARCLLAQAVEAEVTDFLGKHADLKTEDGHQRVVRHGHLPEREVMTGIGPVAVRQPRVRDREADATAPLDVPPRLTIADGALGFWKAAGEVWPKTREQRCWVHKTANVLAK
jgi:transposase-like protein